VAGAKQLAISQSRPCTASDCKCSPYARFSVKAVALTQI